MRENAAGLWLIIVGLFFIASAVIGSKFFDGCGYKKPLFYDRLGKQGSRVLYGTAGVMCVLAGILIIAVMRAS